MFTVYKITNCINNKCYIGSSVRVKKRWKEHINCSKNENDKKYNYPLYRAFRKYGLENFTFEIIKDDFDSIEEMQDYKQSMIIYYNSLCNGYNQTLNTHSNIDSKNSQEHIKKSSKKCAKVDEKEKIIATYKSYHDAARQNGYDGDNYASNIRKVCKGKISSLNGMFFRDLDENDNIIHIDFKKYKGKKRILGINVNSPDEEIYFESVTSAASFLKTDRGSISKCIKGNKRYSIIKGYILREIDLDGNIIQNEINIDDRIKEYQKRNPTINGIQHDIPTWCQIYNIKPATVNYRIRKGWDSVKAITTPVRR